jgi:hypothetical protein
MERLRNLVKMINVVIISSKELENLRQKVFWFD